MKGRWLPSVPALTSLVTGATQAPEATSPADIGPKPTDAEALEYSRVWASKAKQGKGSNLTKVTIVGPVRWHATLTARWPEGKDGKVLEGWLISFDEKPNWGLNPYGRPRKVEILVDKDKVVHWRTQMEWDTRNREVRP